MKVLCLFMATVVATVGAFNIGESRSTASRRNIIEGFTGIMGATLLSSSIPAPALASGGATAGKYT